MADVAAAKRSFYLTRVRIGRLQGLVRQGAGPALLGDLITRGFNMLRWEASSRVRRPSRSLATGCCRLNSPRSLRPGFAANHDHAAGTGSGICEKPIERFTLGVPVLQS